MTSLESPSRQTFSKPLPLANKTAFLNAKATATEMLFSPKFLAPATVGNLNMLADLAI